MFFRSRTELPSWHDRPLRGNPAVAFRAHSVVGYVNVVQHPQSTSDEGRGIQRSMIRLLLDDPNVIGRLKYKLDERAAPPIHPCSFCLLCGVSLAVVRDIGARRDYEFMGQLSII